MNGLIGSETYSSLQLASIHYGSKSVELSRLHPAESGGSLEPSCLRSKVHEMKATGKIGRAAPFVDLSGNAYSVVRQSLSARFLDGTPAFRLSCAGFGSAAFWAAGSAYEVYNGCKDLKRSKAIRDEEGLNRAYATLVSGGSGLGAALIYVVGKGIEIGVDPMCEAALGLGFASNAFFCAGAIAMAGISSVGIYRCRSFRNELDRHIDHPTLPKAQRMAGAIRFLRESLIVTDSEITQIRSQLSSEKPGLSNADFQAKLAERIQEETQVKINALKRRTSVRSLRLILDHSDRILNFLESPHSQETQVGEEAAEKLIQLIKSDSQKKERLHWITLAATILFFVGYLSGCFLSSGILPLLCFAIASGILLLTTLYKFYKSHKERNLEISFVAESALKNRSLLFSIN